MKTICQESPTKGKTKKTKQIQMKKTRGSIGGASDEGPLFAVLWDNLTFLDANRWTLWAWVR
jgi:hypothetical protein